MPALDVTPVKIGDKHIAASEFCDALRRRDLHQYQRTVDRVVDYHLVLQGADRVGVSATDEELQKGADEMRRAHGLSAASATHSWLGYKNLSVDDLEKNVEFWTVGRKLIAKECGADAYKAHFDAHKHQYTRAALSIITVASKDSATDLCDQIKSGKASFQKLAREHSQDAKTASAGGMLGWVTLDGIPESLRGPVSASSGGGEVLDPVESGGAWHVVEVAATSKPEYSSEFDDSIFGDLLTDWLDKERGGVTIEYPKSD
jgi:parvulin-like peptidyl-prolyl isomerase